MNLLVAVDAVFFRTPDGRYYCKTIYSYEFFARYLAVFEEITVTARTCEVGADAVTGYLRADGPRMTIFPYPGIKGSTAYLKALPVILHTAKKATKQADCALIRLPSITAMLSLSVFRRTGKPYALEIVADPSSFGDGNPIFRLLTRHLKNACKKASGVSYVTERYLQELYPSYVRLHGEDGIHFESYYSTATLEESYFSSPRSYASKTQFEIIHVSNQMNNELKGHRILMDALRMVLEQGYTVHLTFIGDGELRPQFEEYAKQLGISDHVTFKGLLSGKEAVRNQLMAADLFVFPSCTEGLPRTLLEAMAVGLPCISTPVGGIPELLEQENLIAPRDSVGFSKRIIELITDTKKMEQESQHNLQVASAYKDTILSMRREWFYTKLKLLTKRGYHL